MFALIKFLDDSLAYYILASLDTVPYYIGYLKENYFKWQLKIGECIPTDKNLIKINKKVPFPLQHHYSLEIFFQTRLSLCNICTGESLVKHTGV